MATFLKAESRRLAQAQLGMDDLLQMLSPRPGVRFYVQGLPDDARVLAVDQDNMRRVFTIVIESPQLDPVDPAVEPPYLHLGVEVTHHDEGRGARPSGTGIPSSPQTETKGR